VWEEISEHMVQRVAIVSGANRGLGRAIALELGSRGVHVVVASRSLEAGRAVAAEIVEAGGSATAFACDVARVDEVNALVEAAVSSRGRVDILVNNAGVIEPIAMIGEADPAAWRHAFDVNVIGAFHAIQAVVPHFVAQEAGGVIVNISSGAAHSPLEGWSAYCASKAALEMLTRSVHLELAAAGVSAYGFMPGVVDTDMQATIRASGVNEVSQLRREQLAPASEPARLVASLCLGRPVELRGRDLSMRDAAVVEESEAASLGDAANG
jgi:NAD(P)-dependent dehydrogenase (short-subunit alcohol dehydrogenase family)